MRKKLLLSLLVVGVVAGLVGVGTTAFFSDTETSTDNVFQAGAIDLLIDNSSWYFGPGEKWVYRDDLSWQLDNLDGSLFFDYEDLKPGDAGEDTVSIHVNNNDAWVCADLWVTRDDDMSSAEPELDAGDAIEDPTDQWDGELASELYFVFWVDDGDNVWEDGEDLLTWGPASNAENGLHYALADTSGNAVWDTPLVGEETYYIGKYWCYGQLGRWKVTQDGQGDTGGNGPDIRGSGFTCDGGPVGNMSQTDAVTADVSFYAVQARHNREFDCSEREYSIPNAQRLRLENKDSNWDVIDDDRYGVLDFRSPYPTFDYTLNVYALNPNTLYALHYYKDPWPSTGGIIIDTFTTDGDGNWSGSNSVELNTDLPTDNSDGNWPQAKIWVVPRADLNGDGSMDVWNQSELLFEWNLVSYDDTDL